MQTRFIQGNLELIEGIWRKQESGAVKVHSAEELEGLVEFSGLVQEFGGGNVEVYLFGQNFLPRPPETSIFL